jgi:hypothetical protein
MKIPRIPRPVLFVILFVALFVFAYFVRAKFFNVPLERDEGEYAYIAQLIDAGGVPYKDAVDQKPPAVFYVYLLIFKLFGASAKSIHVGAFVYNYITAIVVFLLARKLFDDKTAFISAFIYAFVSSERRLLAHAANTELFMLLPMTASWLAALYALDSNRRKILMISGGALAAAAVLFKQVAGTGFAGLILFVLYLAIREKTGLKRFLNDLLCLCSGFIVPLLAVSLYFYWKGAFGDFIYCVILHNISYSNILGNSTSKIFGNFVATAKFILQSQLLWWCFSLFAVVLSVISKKQREKSLIFLFLFSCAGVCVGWRFTLHYFLQVMPVLAVLSAVAIVKILDFITKMPLRPLRPILILAFISAVVSVPIDANRRYFTLSPQELSYTMYSGNPFIEAKEAGKFIEKNSMQNDKVFILGSEPEILFYSNRESASKYIFVYPLTMPYSDALQKQREVVSEIARGNPLYILYVNFPMSIGYGKGAPMYLFEVVSKMIETRYVFSGAFYTQGPVPMFLSARNGAPANMKNPAIYIFKRKF